MSSSFFRPDNLRSASDNRIPTENKIFAIPVGTPPAGGFRDDFMLHYNKIVKSFKIVNNDASITLQYRVNNKESPLREIPPNSDDVLEEWTNYIEILPSTITKAGQLEVDLTTTEDASRLGGS